MPQLQVSSGDSTSAFDCSDIRYKDNRVIVLLSAPSHALLKVSSVVNATKVCPL